MMADLEDIKVGDFVIIVSPESGVKDQVAQVTRVMPRSIEAGPHRYWKSTGRRCGRSDWSPYAIPYDPDHGEKIAEAEYRDGFVRSMRTRKWHDVSTDTMRKIFKILGDEKLRNLT